jgi:ribosome-binding ATPase YchF (GTP1/OBG family)
MKKILFLFLIPLMTFAQFEKSIKLKVAVMQNFIQKGEEGETAFWQTKGKITYAIVNYTEEQNPIFKALFIKQYQELVPIYKKMNVSEDERDTALFIQTLIRHEQEYRNLLTKVQLELYLKKLADFEKNNPTANDSYSSLFFSEQLLKEYIARFK